MRTLSVGHSNALLELIQTFSSPTLVFNGQPALSTHVSSPISLSLSLCALSLLLHHLPIPMLLRERERDREREKAGIWRVCEAVIAEVFPTALGLQFLKEWDWTRPRTTL